LADLRSEISTLRLPIGWSRQQLYLSATGWIFKILGLLLTTLMISLGAPFFFDLLNKLAFVRWAVKPHASTESGVNHREEDYRFRDSVPRD
jgi:hypothetical protein